MPEAATAELDDRRLRAAAADQDTAMPLCEKRKEKMYRTPEEEGETRVLRFAPILLPDTNFFLKRI